MATNTSRSPIDGARSGRSAPADVAATSPRATRMRQRLAARDLGGIADDPTVARPPDDGVATLERARRDRARPAAAPARVDRAAALDPPGAHDAPAGGVRRPAPRSSVPTSSRTRIARVARSSSRPARSRAAASWARAEGVERPPLGSRPPGSPPPPSAAPPPRAGGSRRRRAWPARAGRARRSRPPPRGSGRGRSAAKSASVTSVSWPTPQTTGSEWRDDRPDDRTRR